MSWARIFVYYVLAAFLTFQVVGVGSDDESVVDTAAVFTEPFLPAVPERIDRVRMEDRNMAVQFERRDGKWLTTEPEGLAPPGEVIDALIESLTSLPAIEIVSDGVEHDGQFGFVPPSVRIRIEQEGELVSTVVLGELSPTRTAVYAKKSGSEQVALIGLNAKYYVDLVFENIRRQRRSAGVGLEEERESHAPTDPAGSGSDAPVVDTKDAE